MYQLKAQNGYEIQVIGKGERGFCRVTDRDANVVHTGTYEQCKQWLRDRGVLMLNRGK